jgi:hypothetical protein
MHAQGAVAEAGDTAADKVKRQPTFQPSLDCSAVASTVLSRFGQRVDDVVLVLVLVFVVL